jgi:hypothetical protein
MTNDDGRKPEGAPERSPKAGVGSPSGVDGNGPIGEGFDLSHGGSASAELLTVSLTVSGR